TIRKGRVNYSPNSLAKGCPMHTPENMGAFVHYMEKVEGHKIRERSESFKDHYTQATLFYNSMTEPEKKHIIDAFHFELGKVETVEIRSRMVEHLTKIDWDLAVKVAKGIGVPEPVSADKNHPPQTNIKSNLGGNSNKKSVKDSPALSMEKNKKHYVKGRKLIVLLADGFDASAMNGMKKAFEKEGIDI